MLSEAKHPSAAAFTSKAERSSWPVMLRFTQHDSTGLARYNSLAARSLDWYLFCTICPKNYLTESIFLVYAMINNL